MSNNELVQGSLYEGISAAKEGAEEELTVLTGGSNAAVTVERIVSHGAETGWYDQDTIEFVVLLKGDAALLFEGEHTDRPLKEGDYMIIPKHTRHKVTRTAKGQPTVWLAVHWK